MFQKIRERYCDAELYIFCNDFQLEKDGVKIISSKGIFHNQRVSQEQLAIELLKSDVWFYPTDFYETYCIYAVEAQISEVLCVTTNIGSLEEIVGDRGIIIQHDSTDDQMLNELFKILDDKELKAEKIKKAKEWALKQDIKSLCEGWMKMFNEDE